MADNRTLFVTDAEMIERLGVPAKTAAVVIRALDRDRNSGFPPKQKLWGNRRYWPAVRHYFDVINHVAEDTAGLLRGGREIIF